MPIAPISIVTPLAPEALLFHAMSYTSGLSTLSEMQVTMLSERSDLTADKLLGQQVSVQVKRADESLRHFNGYVSRFGVTRHIGRHFTYQATVRPWLWFLTRTSDCRIFQDMTVPDIVKAVFNDHAIANFHFALFRTYRTWTYCVQYRESDYNFIARLLEQEGIYWYFEHTDGEHKLHLVDSQSSHDAVAGYEALPYVVNSAREAPDVDHVSHWVWADAVETSVTVQNSYDFERPSTLLQAKRTVDHKHALAGYEAFDFQGDWVKQPDGEQWNTDRLDELQTRHLSISGSASSHGITVGKLFTLNGHPHDQQNAKYLVTTTTVRAAVAPHESGGAPVTYAVDFTAVPAGPQYRPPRVSRKPFVQGPQTAVVVGPAGEEIFTDKYGRVKVQFHWDRLGKKNESSSCWVRVSHPWAGKNFGMIHIPRIGQEVVVDFLEGDPDQPMVTGRVYNAEQMPPWELPENATQSGILTRSSQGGAVANANALRFEDKAGSEQVWLHAEKDQDIDVENDETHWVGHDRTKTVDHDEINHIKHDRNETVDNNETITIGVNRSETVGKNETISIGNHRSEAVGGNETISVSGNRAETVGGTESVTIAKASTLLVEKELKTTLNDKETRQVKLDRATSIGASDSLQVGKNFTLVAGDEITLKTGSASLVMKKDGTITLKGKDITVEGSGGIKVKASGNMVLKGAKIAEN